MPYSPRQIEAIRARLSAHQERAARQLVGEAVIDEEFSDLREIEGVRPSKSPPSAPISTARTYQPAISGEKIVDPSTGKTIATINYNGASDAPALRVSTPSGSRHPEIKLTNARINLLIETFERLRPLVVQTETYRLEDDTAKLRHKIAVATAEIAQANVDLERAKKARADMLDQVGLFVPAREA